MHLRPWVRLPSKWIEAGGLKKLSSHVSGVADSSAALIMLLVLAHQADDATGQTKITYDRIQHIAGLSRAKISAGLQTLERLELIERSPAGRSTFRLTNYNPSAGGWCKLPAKGLYTEDGRITFLHQFTLRALVELNALKLYLLFACRRNNNTNFANLTYPQIEQYSGVHRTGIKRAISFLVIHGLVHVEQLPSQRHEGYVNAYRLVSLESRIHMGTRGRGIDTQRELIDA